MAEDEIRTEKCSDIRQHKIKFVLTFSKYDQTLVEICTVAWLGHLSDQTGICRSTLKVLGKCQLSDCYFML